LEKFNTRRSGSDEKSIPPAITGKNRIAELLISRILLFPDHMDIEWKYHFNLE
jgi:hypothetical protein